jgi:myo-inositol-1-phosphate synthase
VNDVRVAVAGVGNCANVLIQGSDMLSQQIDNPEFDWGRAGLLTRDICGFEAGCVSVVLGFDVDERKVGLDLSEAMWKAPNVANEFWVPEAELGPVLPGPLTDGLGISHREQVEVARDHRGLDRDGISQELMDHGVDVLVNFLPVGAEADSLTYAYAAVEAGVAFVNAIPVWVARNEEVRKEFAMARVPLIGDDVKSQVGATILHRAVAEAFQSRGAKINKTHQLNFGGNTDFYNMRDEERLETKRESKTAAVTAVADVDPGAIHIGPSGFIGHLRDEKIAFIEVEGTGFGGNRLRVEMRYSGQDSPNSAAVVYDAVRWAAAMAKLPDDVPQDFMSIPVSAWLMKAPPKPLSDSEAADRCRVLAQTATTDYRLDGDDVALARVAEGEQFPS